MCQCGCGERFERPAQIGAKEWAKRKFSGEEHYRRWQRAQVELTREPEPEPEPEPPVVKSLPVPAWRRPPEPVVYPVRRGPRVDLRRVRVPRPPLQSDESPQDPR